MGIEPTTLRLHIHPRITWCGGGKFHIGVNHSRVKTCRRGRASFALLGHGFLSPDKPTSLPATCELDLHQIEARGPPVGSRGFLEPVKVMLLAYWASLSCYLDFAATVVSIRRDRQRLILETDLRQL